jgi:metal-responsive CopG/Arc/MetJ family transcriptional regulator
MKTTIFIPDQVFEAAEQLAERLGTSRSELYTRAVRDLVEEHRDEDVTTQRDEVYRRAPEESDVDDLLTNLQARSVGRKDW